MVMVEASVKEAVVVSIGGKYGISRCDMSDALGERIGGLIAVRSVTLKSVER